MIGIHQAMNWYSKWPPENLLALRDFDCQPHPRFHSLLIHLCVDRYPLRNVVMKKRCLNFSLFDTFVTFQWCNVWTDQARLFVKDTHDISNCNSITGTHLLKQTDPLPPLLQGFLQLPSLFICSWNLLTLYNVNIRHHHHKSSSLEPVRNKFSVSASFHTYIYILM
jgi:hypothetical protein